MQFSLADGMGFIRAPAHARPKDLVPQSSRGLIGIFNENAGCMAISAVH
jgi:hypothetical protein